MNINIINFTKIARYSIFIALFLFIFVAQAFAQIIITPNRINLSEKKRNVEVIIANTSNEDYASRIDIVSKTMNEKGDIVESKEDKDGHGKDLKQNIRFSPRQVILKAGDHQVVRVSVKDINAFEDGEYIGQLEVKSVPVAAANTLSKKYSGDDTDELSFSIVFIRALTIPLFVNIGNLKSEVDLANFSLEKKMEELSDPQDPSKLVKTEVFYLNGDLKRKGNKSSYVLFKIYENEDYSKELFKSKNIAIYNPLKKISFSQELPKEIFNRLKTGEKLYMKIFQEVQSDVSEPRLVEELSKELAIGN